jgi:hypothetical protein
VYIVVMRIDLKRLRGDAKRLQAARVASPQGRGKTGATQIIRDNFDELERLHNLEGVTWAELASCLAAQGVTQGEGQPLTGRRLTALMHNIRVRATKLNVKKSSQDQADNSPESLRRGSRSVQKSVSLSPEMARATGMRTPDPVISEDEIRRAELAKHAHLLRKR